jgi:hypothetical protein
MKTFRAALLGDLPAIYNLQNVPFRQIAYAGLLPNYETFIESNSEKIRNHVKYFYLLEDDNVPTGFTEYSKEKDGWDLIIWGRSLYTLAYASGKVAFDELGFSKLIGIVRQENVRMLRIYERLQIRMVRKEFTLYYRPGFFSVASTYLHFYEILPDEFREKAEFMKQHASPVLFR